LKTELEQQDIEAIAQRVVELLKPFLSGNSEPSNPDTIFDVVGLSIYLEVSKKWIYERTSLKQIPHIKVKGSNVLQFRKSAIDKWLNANIVPAVDTPSRILKAVK